MVHPQEDKPGDGMWGRETMQRENPVGTFYNYSFIESKLDNHAITESGKYWLVGWAYSCICRLRGWHDCSKQKPGGDQ